MSIPRELFAYTHILAGAVALLAGIVPMIARKGGGNHRLWGKVYFWAMFIICLTAIVLQFYRFTIFLLLITVLSFYAAFSGYRSLFRKNPERGRGPTWLDWGGALIALVSGVSFIAWGLAGLVGYEIIRGVFPAVFFYLALFFGFGLSSSAWTDLRSFVRPSEDKQWWWYYHLNRMLSSYIGAVTAFLVQMSLRTAPLEYNWIFWVAPGIIGGIGIGLWSSYYHKQFAARHAQRSAQAVIG